MNALVVREISKANGTFGFELEHDEKGPKKREGAHQGSTKTSTNSTPTTINPAGYPLGPSGYLPVPQSHSTQSGAAQEKAAMVIQCEDEVLRDAWLKTITDQIKELRDIGLRLENPHWT